jgi:hypothetical protein
MVKYKFRDSKVDPEGPLRIEEIHVLWIDDGGAILDFLGEYTDDPGPGAEWIDRFKLGDGDGSLSVVTSCRPILKTAWRTIDVTKHSIVANGTWKVALPTSLSVIPLAVVVGVWKNFPAVAFGGLNLTPERAINWRQN